MTVSITKTISISKALALGGLCALFASVGSAAFAQGDFHHGPMHPNAMHHARHAILRQKAAYSRAVAHGNYQAAERAHLKASKIRHHVRARRHEMHRDHGY